jgi:hypothetical protein
MQSSSVDLGQQNTIYRLKPLDVEILIEEIAISATKCWSSTTYFDFAIVLNIFQNTAKRK